MKNDWSSRLLLILGLAPSGVYAQEKISFDPHASFDRSPWVSARAAGMSEAVSPIANGLEAPYYNPALIGGLNYKQMRGPVSNLQFPSVGAAWGPSSMPLMKEVAQGGSPRTPAAAEQLRRAYDGSHAYGRFTLLPTVTFYRVFVGYVYDSRAAAVPRSDASDVIDVASQQQSGPMLGFSLGSPTRNFYLGLSTAFIQRAEIQGSIPLSVPDPAEGEEDALPQGFDLIENRFRGSPLHLGTLYSFNYRWRPSISLVARNLLGTLYSSSNSEVASYKEREDITLGFGLSPNLGTWGIWSSVLEFADTTRSDKSFASKVRFGSELTFGNAFGAQAGFALRMGYRQAGPSFGLGVNLGLIGIQAATYAEDIGIDGERMIERKSMVNVGINIAD